MNNKTVLGLSKGDKVILTILPLILGALLGWFIPNFAGWLSKLPFIPFGGILEKISTLESHWVPIIGVVVGIIAGIIFTMYAFTETLNIILTDKEVKLTIKGETETFTKKDITAVFLEKKQLLLLGHDGIELYRGKPEVKKVIVEDSFKQHGYPWKEEDPFKNQYQRWVADHPDYPAHINTLLAARERAIKNDQTKEVQILRKDLAKLGVIIRDEEKRQYIRIVSGEDK